MINFEKLEEVVADQVQTFTKKEIGLLRNIDFDKYYQTKQITVISGIRRSGKSTLLRQFATKYPRFHFINFDDDRLIGFDVTDFDTLLTILLKNHSEKVIFLDEIQNIDQWEKFVRRLFEEGYKIFLTGSYAKLLSSELSTRLTGRYVKIELYPFSFFEYLQFYQTDIHVKTKANKVKILKYFDKYLLSGGFPEYLKYDDSEFLKRIYDDILYRDLLTRFNIRHVKSFKQLANYLFSNFTKKINYQSLKKNLGFKSAISVKNNIQFMEESYLIFELYKYDFSLKKQYTSEKKIYVIDNGLRNSIAFYFSTDAGRLLENLVFVELQRRGLEVYFFKDKKECDFVIRDKDKLIQAIQVCLILNENNIDRELSGLIEAMDKLKITQGIILTKNVEKNITKNGQKIKIMPVYKWLLR